jgi:hypothetical protein
MRRTPSALTRATAPAAVLGTVLAVLAGCSGDADQPPEPPPSSSAAGETAAPEPPRLETRATIRTVSGGRLAPAARDTLRDKITEAVDAWFEGAFLGGEYPRTDFDDAFGAFTPRAAALAERDRQLMSNAAVGTTTYAVRATARRLRIDVLAAGGRASAVTAQFRLGMARAGETGAERSERVQGRLYLTYDGKDGWRVFGYEVDREVV